MDSTTQEICIHKNSTLITALKQMDEVNRKLLIVLNDDDTFYSVVSIGDIQRALIKNMPLDTNVVSIIRGDITVAHANDDIDEVKERMKIRRNEFMPIIDSNNKIIKVIFWEDLFVEKRFRSHFDLPVVIMAGGIGSRLKPLTNILPKPLIPIDSKTIIEDIMDRFVEHGCQDFYLSVNYKADLIRYYFESKNDSKYQISYLQEDNPLGTAGSLSLLRGKIESTFFVSNCDIIVDQDYSEILQYHKESNNEMTIVAALKHIPLAFGIVETGNNGKLLQLKEKPELNFKINSGMYVIEPHILNEIPVNQFLHITDFINNLLSKNRQIGVFPVSEKSWRDIGTWNEYIRSQAIQR